MKILKLEISNLASLDNPDGEIIDFEGQILGQSNIFSIVGPTGSGKSTILDAICLALYNKAPRYPRQKGAAKKTFEILGTPDDDEKNRLSSSDGRNILTRGKKSGYSKLTFKANDGNTYRAEWLVRLKAKKFEDAHNYLFLISPGPDRILETQKVWNDIPDIIGLDYEQFLRTVLIAQGSFAGFLKASEEDRYLLLEKIAGGRDLYVRIAEEINARKKTASEDFAKINTQLETLSKKIIPADLLTEKKDQLLALKDKEMKITKDLEDANRNLKWWDDLVLLQRKIDGCSQRLDKAKEDIMAFKSIDDRLSLHDAILPAISIASESERLSKEIAAISNGIQAITAEKEIADKDAQDLRKTLSETICNKEKARELLDNTAPKITDARERSARLRAVSNLRSEIQRTISQKENDLKKAVADAKANKDAHEAAVRQSKEINDSIASLISESKKKSDSFNEEIGKVEQKIVLLNDKIVGKDPESLHRQLNLDKDYLMALKEMSGFCSRLSEIKTSREELELRKSRLAAANKANGDALAGLDIKSLEDNVDTLVKTLTILSSSNFKAQRDLLRPGEPCPLCGALEHPFANNADRVEIANEEINLRLAKEKKALNAMREQIKSLNGEIQKNTGELNSISGQLDQLQKDSDSILKSQTALRDKFPDIPDLPDSIQSLIALKESLLNDLNSTIAEVDRHVKLIDDARKEKEKLQTSLALHEKKASDQIDARKARQNSLDSQCSALGALSPKLAEAIDSLRKELDQLSANVKAAEKEEQTLASEITALIGNNNPDELERNLNDALKKLDNAVASLTESSNNLDKKLGELNGRSVVLINSKKDLNLRLKESGDALAKWIDDFNADKSRQVIIDSDIILEMTHASDDWESIRTQKENRIKTLTEAHALLHNETENLKKHELSRPENSRSEIEIMIDDMKKSDVRDRMIALVSEINAHDDALKTIGDQMPELTRRKNIMSDWDEIDSAIGKDGKTMRKVAQCYTLGFLIYHANREIRRFNNRYELIQVKDSLGIRVIDHDRADDVRDTSTLSGGETFIVSLGLALGLSALSSRHIAFGNLFIDEGFGTLDAETLSTVIDSLAMLQMSQGKKVGIISHTDTMSERISTQIRIKKLGNTGSSRIEIVN